MEVVIDQLRALVVTCLYQDLHCTALLVSCIDVRNLSAYHVPCALMCTCLQGDRIRRKVCHCIWILTRQSLRGLPQCLAILGIPSTDVFLSRVFSIFVVHIVELVKLVGLMIAMSNDQVG